MDKLEGLKMESNNQFIYGANGKIDYRPQVNIDLERGMFICLSNASIINFRQKGSM